MINKVLVDAVSYDISHTDEVILVENQACRADVDFNTAQIRLNNEGAGKGREIQTLMHEIVHAMLYERGLDDKFVQNEMLVDEMSCGIINLIRANPKLIDLINGKAE